MRASAYLGDLGGLSRQRQLVMLDLRGTGDSAVPADPATYRCDWQVADVEVLCDHLGLDRVDLLAHSAAGDLALLYAAKHLRRIRTLILVTSRARALGVEFTREERLEAAALRAAEPWFKAAYPAWEAFWAGSAASADLEAIAPFFYGRWDAASQAHAASEEHQHNPLAAAVYASDGAFDPAASRAAIAALEAPVLVVAGELDSGPLPRVAEVVTTMFPKAELVIQPGAGHFPWLDDPHYFTQTVEAFFTHGVPAPVT
jgi:pimeloyl-ACP methyl ester carboxylesterase